MTMETRVKCCKGLIGHVDVTGVDEAGEVEPWVLDTGASDHMSPNARSMVTYREADKTVRAADGSTRKIEGYRDVPLSYRPGDAEMTICLTGVAHASIPQRRHHLI